MWFKDFLKQQQSGLEAMANTGVIGLHLVSGPAVGFAIGYGLDRWLGTSPWCKLIFLVVGIGAGFLNVYRDTRALLRKIEAQDAARRAALTHAADAEPSGQRTADSPGGKGPHGRNVDKAKGLARTQEATQRATAVPPSAGQAESAPRLTVAEATAAAAQAPQDDALPEKTTRRTADAAQGNTADADRGEQSATDVP